MLEAPIPGLIGRLAVPTIISMLVTSIYNMADTYFVSHIGAGDGATSASGAVSIVFSLMAIIQAVGFTVGMGAGSITSRLLGKGWKERADQYASSAVILGLVLGLLLMSVCFVWIDELVWLLGATPTIYPYALDYARYIIFGAPVMILAYILNNLLRWQGKANRSVIGLGFGGLLNIVLDPILIFTFDMGISGAAIATLFSQCVSLAILASFFVRGQSDIRVSPRLIAREAKVYGDILKSGLPSFLRQGMSSVASVSLNLNAGLYGDPAVAAMGIVTKVFTFIMSVVIGFGQGFQPVVGFNYGAGGWTGAGEREVLHEVLHLGADCGGRHWVSFRTPSDPLLPGGHGGDRHRGPGFPVPVCQPSPGGGAGLCQHALPVAGVLLEGLLPGRMPAGAVLYPSDLPAAQAV